MSKAGSDEARLARVQAKLANMPEPFRTGMLSCVKRQLLNGAPWQQSGRLWSMDEGSVRFYRDGTAEALRTILRRGYLRWLALPFLALAAMGLQDTWSSHGPRNASHLILPTLGLSGLLLASLWWFWFFRPVPHARPGLFTRGLYIFADDLVIWSTIDEKDHLRQIPRAQVKALRAAFGQRNKAACLVIDYTDASGQPQSVRCTIGMPTPAEVHTLDHWRETGTLS
ncbi:MAG: hypothetical protein AAGA56_08490 [Myxococcota bacterium]